MCVCKRLTSAVCYSLHFYFVLFCRVLNVVPYNKGMNKCKALLKFEFALIT